MSTYTRLAAVSAFSLALSACGGGATDAEETAVDAEEIAEGVADAAAEENAADEASDAAEDANEEEASEDGAGEEAEAEPVAAPEPAPEPEPVAAMVPPAAFVQCGICHSVESGENGIGPSLAGVAGRAAGSASDFNYTPGMRSSGLTWDEATLDLYLADPSGLVPGTTMAIANLSEGDRAEIIAYLKTL